MPVLVLTSSEQPADRARAAALGATSCAVEPSPISALVQLLEGITRPHPIVL